MSEPIVNDNSSEQPQDGPKKEMVQVPREEWESVNRSEAASRSRLQVLQVQNDLSRAFAKYMPADAAANQAKAASIGCTVNSAGVLMHDALGSIGAEQIAEAWWNSPENFWLRQGGNRPNIATVGQTLGWSIEEAVKNSDYNARWQKADPAGCDRAWNEYLQKEHAALKAGKR